MKRAQRAKRGKRTKQKNHAKEVLLIALSLMAIIIICHRAAVASTSVSGTVPQEVKQPEPPNTPEEKSQQVVEVQPQAHEEIQKVEPLTPPPPPPSTIDCSVLKCIALTFDDGPRGYTPELIDVLDARGAKATFFVLGPLAEKYPDTIRKMHASGHQIGNHTYGHRNLVTLPLDQAMGEVGRTNDVIAGITGEYPRVVRPPYGSMTPELAATIGMPEIVWSVDTRDWQHGNTQMTIDNVLYAAGRGDIVLMHDIYASTVNAAPAIVDGLQVAGYTLVTIDQLFGNRQLPPQIYYRQ